MVRYEKSARRKRFEDIIKEQQRLEEQKRQLERTTMELEERQKHPLREYPIGRRHSIKKIGLAVGGLVLGTSALGAISYLFSPRQYTPPETVSIETSKETYQETPVEQSQTIEQSKTIEQKTTNPMDDPDNWPMKSTLYDLRNAQFEPGSFSQYIAPEYDSERYIYTQSTDTYTNTIPDQYWIKMTRDELLRLWGSTRTDREIDEMLAGGAEFAVYILRQGGSYYFRAPNRWRGSDGKYWWRFGDLYSDEILKIWEPDDLDKVLFRNSSGSFKVIAEG